VQTLANFDGAFTAKKKKLIVVPRSRWRGTAKPWCRSSCRRRRNTNTGLNATKTLFLLH